MGVKNVDSWARIIRRQLPEDTEKYIFCEEYAKMDTNTITISRRFTKLGSGEEDLNWSQFFCVFKIIFFSLSFRFLSLLRAHAHIQTHTHTHTHTHTDTHTYRQRERERGTHKKHRVLFSLPYSYSMLLLPIFYHWNTFFPSVVQKLSPPLSLFLSISHTHSHVLTIFLTNSPSHKKSFPSLSSF